MDATLVRDTYRTAMALLLFAVAGAALLAGTFSLTQPAIERSERAAKLKLIAQTLPTGGFDNNPVSDSLVLRPHPLLGLKRPGQAYVAYRGARPVAVALEVAAPDGYSGEIKLLVAINYDGTLMGVRVVSHRETPGLGDKIEVERTDWVTKFTGHSLYTTDGREWAVRRDGGVFDQFTGATITPRAIVKAVYKCLQYFVINRDGLFNPRVTTTILEDTVEDEDE